MIATHQLDLHAGKPLFIVVPQAVPVFIQPAQVAQFARQYAANVHALVGFSHLNGDHVTLAGTSAALCNDAGMRIVFQPGIRRFNHKVTFRQLHRYIVVAGQKTIELIVSILRRGYAAVSIALHIRQGNNSFREGTVYAALINPYLTADAVQPHKAKRQVIL